MPPAPFDKGDTGQSKDLNSCLKVTETPNGTYHN